MAKIERASITVLAWENSGEPHRRTGNFSDENPSVSNLLKRQFNGVRVSQQRITIPRVIE